VEAIQIKASSGGADFLAVVRRLFDRGVSTPRREKLYAVAHCLRFDGADQAHQSPQFLAGRVSLLRRDNDTSVLPAFTQPILMKNAVVRNIEDV